MKNVNTEPAKVEPFLVVGIVVIAVGIVLVAFMMIETLQENSTKLRKYKVQPNPIIATQGAVTPELEYFKHTWQREDDVWKKQSKAMTLLDKGTRLKASGDPKAAIAMYENGLRDYKAVMKTGVATSFDAHNLARGYEEIAECYCSLHQFPLALAACNEAIKLTPSASRLFTDRAFIYKMLGQPAKETQAQTKRVSSAPIRSLWD